MCLVRTSLISLGLRQSERESGTQSDSRGSGLLWVQAELGPGTVCEYMCEETDRGLRASWGVGAETWGGGKEGKVARESGEGLGGQEGCRVSGRAWLQGSHSAAP